MNRFDDLNKPLTHTPEEDHLEEKELQEAWQMQRKLMAKNQMQMLLRVTLQVSAGELGQLSWNGQKPRDDYTGNHLAMFECELSVPPMLSLVDHTYRDYLLKHRINFKNWRIADLDNYMNGNPYFSDFLTESDWQENVDEKIGNAKEEILRGN